jgi:hypothetical protein
MKTELKEATEKRMKKHEKKLSGTFATVFKEPNIWVVGIQECQRSNKQFK